MGYVYIVHQLQLQKNASIRILPRRIGPPQPEGTSGTDSFCSHPRRGQYQAVKLPDVKDEDNTRSDTTQELKKCTGPSDSLEMCVLCSRDGRGIVRGVSSRASSQVSAPVHKRLGAEEWRTIEEPTGRRLYPYDTITKEPGRLCMWLYLVCGIG